MVSLMQSWIYPNLPLLSEFQLRDFGVKIDLIYCRHGGTQKSVIQNEGDPLVKLLEPVGFMIHFMH
jgi:hypothetical protein